MSSRQVCSVRLRPIFLHEETRGRFSVIRWGGANRIFTNTAGADAIRCMVRGLSLEQIKYELTKRYGRSAETIQLNVLVDTLTRADLIASVDGHSVRCRRPITIRSLLKFVFRFHIKNGLMRFCHRYFPFSVLRCVYFVFTRIDWSTAIEKKTDEALHRVRELSRLPGSLQSFAHFRRAYRRNFIWKMAEVQALVSSKPDNVDRWLERNVDLDGKGHLDACLSLKRGVILCPFRFGCPMLIPLVLIRAGYSLTQITVPGGVSYTSGLEDFQKLRPTFGTYHEVRDLTLARYRTVLPILEAGGLVVWLPDFLGPSDHSTETADAETNLEGLSASKLRTSLPKACIELPFCGGRILMNRWVGTFAVMTGSSVIPAALLRIGGKLRLVLHPPIMPGVLADKPSCRADATDKALFASLEWLVQQYPAQWLAWRHVQFAAKQA